MTSTTANPHDPAVLLSEQPRRPAPAAPPPRGRGADVGRAALGILGRLAVVGAVIGLWWLATEAELWDQLILPTPATVWDAFVQSVTTHDGQRGLSNAYLWEHLWASVERILQGVGWGIVVGIPLGLAIATFRPFRFVVAPIVHFVRSLPPLAYFSLLIIWFGIDDESKIWLLFLAALAPIVIATVAGVESVTQERIDAARALGASRRQVTLRVLAPAALPQMFTGVRVAVGFAWTTIVAAETVNGLPGIGGLAWETKKQLRTDVAILCVIVIGITALLLDGIVVLVERAVVPWKGKG